MAIPRHRAGVQQNSSLVVALSVAGMAAMIAGFMACTQTPDRGAAAPAERAPKPAKESARKSAATDEVSLDKDSPVEDVAAPAETHAPADTRDVPPGAAALGYTKCVIDEKPTADDVAAGPNGKHKWFSGQWWGGNGPPLSKYSTKDGVLAMEFGGDLVSTPKDFSEGLLPLLPGPDGFYVEFEYWLSGNDPDHFPAVWLMPAEHSGAQLDKYAGDPPGYERWMEFDIDEAGFGPGLTGTVHSHYGIWKEGYQQIQNPNNVSSVALDRSKKHTFGGSYDPLTQTVTWWVDGVKQMSATSPFVPDVAKKQHFYLIISAQAHGKKKDYTLFVSGVRAYVLPSSELPAAPVR